MPVPAPSEAVTVAVTALAAQVAALAAGGARAADHARRGPSRPAVRTRRPQGALRDLVQAADDLGDAVEAASAAGRPMAANRVGEQARRQLDLLTGDPAALGLFVDAQLRLDLAAPDVQRPITELRFLVPPAPVPLPGPAPDPGQPPGGYSPVPSSAPAAAQP